jgi:hypothetical protein
MKRLFACCIALCLGFSFAAHAVDLNPSKINRPPAPLLVIPTQLTVQASKHAPYAAYAVYNETTTAFLAAFSSRKAAELYASTLVKEGNYASYRYADYTLPALPTTP